MALKPVFLKKQRFLNNNTSATSGQLQQAFAATLIPLSSYACSSLQTQREHKKHYKNDPFANNNQHDDCQAIRLYIYFIHAMEKQKYQI